MKEQAGPKIKTKYRATVNELHEAFLTAWADGKVIIDAFSPHNTIMCFEAARRHALGEYTADPGSVELAKQYSILSAQLKSLVFHKVEGAVYISIDRNLYVRLIEALEKKEPKAPDPAELSIPPGASIFGSGEEKQKPVDPETNS